MTTAKLPRVTIVVPLYNESAGVEAFHTVLTDALAGVKTAEMTVLYCDDGSRDNTVEIAGKLADGKAVKLLALSRNFGKEACLSAGIEAAVNDGAEAIIMCDGDGQHPVELIADFVAQWRNGAQVVVGVRRESKSDSIFKRLGSSLFYSIMSQISHQTLLPGSTDFRLIDREVAYEFIRLEEQGRMTRGLIDWLGFRREYIYFDANDRLAGEAAYSTSKLIGLALQAAISMSFRPLYFFGYLGAVIAGLASLLALFVFVEQILMGDPLYINFTGTAMLAILIVFLVGLLMMSQGVVSVYLASIHRETRRRPLFIVDYSRSKGVKRVS